MDIKYTKDHEWVRVDKDAATVGISAHAAEQLGDIVFVELPEVGRQFEKGQEMAVVESVKAASDVYAPISGEVVEINQAIVDEPAKVNEEAEGAGWFVKLRALHPDQFSDLMDEAAYRNFVEQS